MIMHSGMGGLGGLGELGDASACGANPCGWWDYVWSSAACDSYLSCAGLPPMTISGQLGAGVQSITSGAASVVGAGVTGATSNWVADIALLAAAALVVLALLEK